MDVSSLLCELRTVSIDTLESPVIVVALLIVAIFASSIDEGYEKMKKHRRFLSVLIAFLLVPLGVLAWLTSKCALP